MISSFFAPNGFAIDNGILWFVPYSDRLLCGYSIKEKKIICVKVIPEQIPEMALVRNVFVSEGKVYLIPSIIGHIYIYDIEKNKFESIPIEVKKDEMNFYAAYVYKDDIFIFPAKNVFVLKVNIKNNSIEKIKIIEESLEDKNQDSYFAFSSCNICNKIILLKRKSKSICVFDMEKLQFEYKEIEQASGYYGTATCISDSEIALTDNDGNIIVYNLISGTTKKNINAIDEFEAKLFDSSFPCFASTIYNKGKIYMFPATGNMILEMDTREEIIKKSLWKKYISSTSENYNVQMFSEIKMYNDSGYGFYVKKGILVKIDFENHAIIELPLEFDDSCIATLEQYAICEFKNHSIREGKTVIGNIYNLIDYIVEERKI